MSFALFYGPNLFWREPRVSSAIAAETAGRWLDPCDALFWLCMRRGPFLSIKLREWCESY